MVKREGSHVAKVGALTQPPEEASKKPHEGNKAAADGAKGA